MLPAFASFLELDARIPGGIADEDVERAQAALDDASTLIRAEASQNYVDDQGALTLPAGADAWRADVLVRVCLSAARRQLDNPDGISQEALGAYSVQQANASSDVYLTTAERRDVRRAAKKTGVTTVSTTRSDLASDGRPYGLEVSEWNNSRVDRDVDPGALVDVDGGDAVPWVSPDGF